MRKIFIILTTILFSCSNNDDNCDVEMDVDDIEKSITYYIELNNSTTRVGFNQITLPGYVFSPTSQEQTFTLDQGMSGGVNDVRVTLSGKCSVGNSNVNKEIFVNFLEDKPTVVFSISRVVTCSPEIEISYK
jgi:hypothetical protein